MTNIKSMPAVGDRVEFIEGWDIFSEGVIIPKGARGTVEACDDGDFAVKMDDHFDLDEWENVVFLNPRDFADDNGMTAAQWVRTYVREI